MSLLLDKRLKLAKRVGDFVTRSGAFCGEGWKAALQPAARASSATEDTNAGASHRHKTTVKPNQNLPLPAIVLSAKKK
jgi:hypothetical protein